MPCPGPRPGPRAAAARQGRDVGRDQVVPRALAGRPALGYPQQGFRDEIGARMPDAREFEFFGLTTGTPVIVVSRTAYGEARAIRLTRYVYRADRVRLAHEVATIPEKYQNAERR